MSNKNNKNCWCCGVAQDLHDYTLDRLDREEDKKYQQQQLSEEFLDQDYEEYLEEKRLKGVYKWNKQLKYK
jgi:hypothetical protein